MEKIKVDKSKLIETLRTNRDLHRAVFLKAVEGFRADAIREFEEAIVRLQDGKSIRPTYYMQTPTDQTRDYDRAIQMLELSVDAQIQLTEADFKCYVQDDWSWKKHWVASNSKHYAGAMFAGEAATVASYQPDGDED